MSGKSKSPARQRKPALKDEATPSASSSTGPSSSETTPVRTKSSSSSGATPPPSTTTNTTSAVTTAGFFKVWMFLVLYVVGSTAIPIFLHHKKYGRLPSLMFCALAFFLPLNILINVWEIALGLYIGHIKDSYLKLKDEYGASRMSAVTNWFFRESISLPQILSLKYWSRIWSTYSLYDPSYSNKESFGFFIDVGNGWVTIIPSFLMLAAMTCGGASSKELTIYGNFSISQATLGLLNFVIFYQELYGTILYALSFWWNERYRDKTTFEVLLFVGLSNGLWFIFPIIGMFCSYKMIIDGSNEVFTSSKY